MINGAWPDYDGHKMCDTEQIKMIFLFNIPSLSAGMSKGTHSQEWGHEGEVIIFFYTLGEKNAFKSRHQQKPATWRLK